MSQHVTEALARDLLRSLFDAMPQLGWTARPDGHIDYYNPRWYAYTGTTVEAMQGWGWKTVHDPALLPQVMERWERSLATGEPFEMEFLLRRHDGEMRWFLTRVEPMRNERGEIVRWVGINTDIHEQVRLERELRASEQRAIRANRAKDEFLAMLGHELRNPLAPIRTAIELMNLKLEPDVVRQEREMIERQVAHLVAMVDDLLDVARVTRGKLPLRRRVVDLADVVSAAVGTASPMLEQKQHRLTIEVPRRRFVVHGDPARLGQVVSNLLINAAKYTPDAGHVAVEASGGEDGHVALTVRDDGDGLSEELLARLFEPFEQSAQSIERSDGGLGLGLAIARSLVELHDGTITATSAGPAKGSTFTVRLPLRDPTELREDEPDDAPRSRTISAAPASTVERVLLVDDNADAAEALAARLTRHGYVTAVAHDGAEALKVAEAFGPDVCVLDIGLPLLDGYELARRLREQLEPRPRLVALTGYGQRSDKERARAAGFEHHITKPVRFEALVASIEGVTGDAPPHR